MEQVPSFAKFSIFFFKIHSRFSRFSKFFLKSRFSRFTLKSRIFQISPKVQVFQVFQIFPKVQVVHYGCRRGGCCIIHEHAKLRALLGSRLWLRQGSPVSIEDYISNSRSTAQRLFCSQFLWRFFGFAFWWLGSCWVSVFFAVFAWLFGSVGLFGWLVSRWVSRFLPFSLAFGSVGLLGWLWSRWVGCGRAGCNHHHPTQNENTYSNDSMSHAHTYHQ